MPHPLHPSPQVIFSTALHLPLPLRREAEQRLNCPVIDLYSTAETGPLACACPDSDQNFHIFAPEIDVALDAFGLLVTRHSDAILPLLNYRIQDYAENLAPRCSKCTHIGPTLLGFRGRTVSTKGEHSRAAQALSAVPL
jgi:phenylacetate-coenzyme A ligase PaaK-like adenylate-forming protein